MSSNSALKRHGGLTTAAIAISTNSPSPVVMGNWLSAREGAGNV